MLCSLTTTQTTTVGSLIYKSFLFKSKQFGLTALMLAAKNDHPKVVKFLLDKGADLKIVDMVSSSDLNTSA